MMQQLRLAILLLAVCISATNCKKENLEDKLLNTTVDTLVQNKFDHKVLLEPFTSTTCGDCPLAHYEIDRIEGQNEHVIHLTHYISGPLNHDYTDYVIEKADKTMYTPLSFVQRENGTAGVVYFVIDRLEEFIEVEFSSEPAIGLSIETSTVGQTVTVDVELIANEMFGVNSSALTVLVVENMVIGSGSGYDQRNYGHTDESHPYYNKGEYIEGFEHTNVIRHVISSYDGDAIELENNRANWTGTFNTDMLANDIEAYSIIAFASESANVGSPILNAALLSF